MPLPTPRNNEKRGDFMGRCVSDLTEKGEFNDNKQRVAVCLNIFKDAESKASVVFDDGEDTTLFFTRLRWCLCATLWSSPFCSFRNFS